MRNDWGKNTMKITILYDNTSNYPDLIPDWGFSCLVEAYGKKILFDTGAKGEILLNNMKTLKVNPLEIDEIFISHLHWDHTGGLSAFLRLNNQVKLWIPSYFREAKAAKEAIEVKVPTKLYEGIYSTGELEGIEQSLCVETEKGIVIIAGCSHPKMEHILQVASEFGKVHGIIGGLHGTEPESLKGLNLICATHCTQYKSRIKSLYPQEYIEGGAGRVIEIG